MKKIGVIGGSGLYEIKGLRVSKRKKISTPFGRPSDEYVIGRTGDTEVSFLPRHGSRHDIPPHLINYRANIWGFKKLGVQRIISVGAVGGIKKDLKPGTVVILDQIIDMTKARASTFYEGKTAGRRAEVVHIDLTGPYCPEMRKVILRSGQTSKVPLKNGGTYMAVEGPRLETAAEIRAFARLGGSVVGMTGMPEASLARELEICYSGISVVANYAAGITSGKLTTKEVMDGMKASTEKIRRLLEQIFRHVPEKRKCPCKDALKDAKL
ncbi:S-methyl-5'-thioinosine phosphorylase [bacterium BMS3Bbin08]|nr:S-methyl-5'-thioinosine phosphorylase [bacterium BMS3Bbin08]HDH50734.1 S-methyl-5'-thioadenosine phosphorylase [Nitrospirota bacterium]